MKNPIIDAIMFMADGNEIGWDTDPHVRGIVQTLDRREARSEIRALHEPRVVLLGSILVAGETA